MKNFIGVVAITLLITAAGVARAEVVFSDDFENQPNLTNGPSPSSVGGICTGHDPSAASANFSGPGVKVCSQGGCCENMPRGWSYYLSKSINGAETLQIKSGGANDGHDGLGGNKSVYYHMIATDTTGSPNDAQLNWHYLDSLDHRKGLPDMWVRYRVRVSPQWNLDTDNGGGGSNMLKLGRFGNYLGNGERNGPDSREFYGWESNINDTTHVPFTYHNMGKTSNFFYQASLRCGNYCYECCLNPSCNSAGGSCASGGGSDTQRFIWNYARARYCESPSGDVTEQYIDSSDPLYKPRWDQSVMCNDGTGSGTLMEADRGPEPICYGFGSNTAANGEKCNEPYSSGTSCPAGNCNNYWDDKSPGNIHDGDWHEWTFHLKMNTCHGCADGWFEQWIDGYKVHDLKTIRWIPSGWQSEHSGHDYPNDIRGFNYFGLFGNKAARVGMGSTTNHWMAVDDVVIATTESDLDNHPYYLGGGGGDPACSDGNDNDGDGLTDAADPGCSSDADTSEQSSSLICDDGQDNDGDGLKDTADPGCSSPADGSEQSSALICDDGLDNDNDGSVDSADGGCSSPTDNNEANCGDGTVNGGEVCDGSDLAGQDCTDQGFVLPAGLACNASCSAFVTSNCSNEEPIVECMTFDETDDYVSVPDSSTLSMPSGDWTVGIYSRVTDTTGSAFQYLLSNNSPSANSSFNLLLDESTGRWEGRVRDAQGDQVLLSGGAIPANGTWRLLAMRKTGTNFDLLYCSAGSCSVEASDQNAAVGDVNGGEWNIGRRVDGDVDRYFGGDACYMFVMDRAMSDGELGDTSRWVEPLDTGLVHLGVDLLSDRTGNGHNGVYHGGIQGSNFGPPLVQPSCGNGIQEAGEQCDQGDFGGQTCQSAGFGTGSLACTGSCVLDTTGCGTSTVPPNVNNVERTDTQE